MLFADKQLPFWGNTSQQLGHPCPCALPGAPPALTSSSIQDMLSCRQLGCPSSIDLLFLYTGYALVQATRLVCKYLLGHAISSIYRQIGIDGYSGKFQAPTCTSYTPTFKLPPVHAQVRRHFSIESLPFCIILYAALWTLTSYQNTIQFSLFHHNWCMVYYMMHTWCQVLSNSHMKYLQPRTFFAMIAAKLRSFPWRALSTLLQNNKKHPRKSRSQSGANKRKWNVGYPVKYVSYMSVGWMAISGAPLLFHSLGLTVWSFHLIRTLL